MFQELNNILNATPETCEQGISVLLSDKQTDGGFLVHHFLSFYLKGGCKVCFLGLLQSFSHYSLVAQKLGVNLSAAREKGQLVFLEGLRSSLDLLLDDQQNSTLHKSSPLQFLSSPNTSLRSLYEFVCTSVQKTSETAWKFPVLIIDDLSVLLSLGVTTKDVLNFMHYCRATLCSKLKERQRLRLPELPENLQPFPLLLAAEFLVLCNTHKLLEELNRSGSIYRKEETVNILGQDPSSGLERKMRNPSNKGNLVALVHNTEDLEDEENDFVVKSLSYQSHLILQAEGLATGYCKDIHGELKIIWRSFSPVRAEKNVTKIFQYKIQDKNVAFFARGTSSAVL